MGSYIELNDTLQLTTEQGFPQELNFEKHQEKPFSTETFKDNIYEFKNKSGIRVYQLPPIRNFLVHNINGKWLYWGLVHVLEVKHDNLNKTTSGKFKIIHLYSPEEIKNIHQILDQRKETDYFAQ